MFGFGSQAAAQPPVDPSVALPAQPAPQQAPLPGQPGYSPSKVDMLLDMIWNGHSPMDASMAVRGRDAGVYQQQLMRQIYTKAQQDDPSGALLTAMMLNSGETGKALADRLSTHTLKGGETLVNGGPGGAPLTATTYGLDNGVGYALGPNVPGGLALSAQRAPGETKVDAESGGLYNNNGPTGQQFSRWRTYEPTQTAGDAFAGIKGLAPGFPAAPGVALPATPSGAASTPGAPSAAAAPTQGAMPRGLRNNNPGNIMALPSGHMWDGQTGIDPAGYAVFATPEAGMKAAATNLQSYSKLHGINTVSGVVSRWAPQAAGNNTGNYAAYIAQQMGVDPNQKLNMSDPSVQHGILSGIFSFENGPKAMASWQPQAQAAAAHAMPASAQAAAAPARATGDIAPSFSAVHQGALVRNATPEEMTAAGYPPGAVGQVKPDGTIDVKQAGFGPDQLISMRSKLADSEPIKNWQMANDAYGAMINAAAQPNGGMRAYALRDTFARAINPGGVARAGTIEAIKDAQGIPANVKAYFMNLKGDGDVPPEIAQQILDVTHGFVSSHYAGAKAVNDNYAEFARMNHINPDQITVQLGEGPGRMVVGPLPPKAQLVTGQIYATPRGPAVWSGNSFRRYGGH